MWLLFTHKYMVPLAAGCNGKKTQTVFKRLNCEPECAYMEETLLMCDTQNTNSICMILNTPTLNILQ